MLSWAPAGYFVGTVVDTENGDSWTEYIAYQGTVGCPSGYESTGSGACELLNPRSAQPDSRVDITRGNTYTHDDIDSLPSGVRISGGKVIIEGVNPEGQAHRYTVSPSSVDTVITHQVQTSPTSIQVQRMTLSMPGDIAAVDSYTEAGSISTTTTTPGTGMEWPSDYARQHEAGQAADRVIEELRDVKKFTVFEKLLSWFETEDVPTLPQSDDYEETLRGEFEGLLTWRLPDHSSECPTPTFHIFDQAHVMDSHCFLLEQNRGLIALILQAMFTISALFVVLGA